jgi:hypothetical protein
MNHGDVSPTIAKGLLALRERIVASKIRSSKIDETMTFAVWNIREFGKKARLTESIHYIAEILGQFDLIALVELRDDLTDLGKVLPILGPSWHVVYSDSQQDSGGNSERLAFLYDTRAVTFNGLAAEIDAPRAKEGEEYLAKQSFWRAPYMCSFRSGNFDFIAIAQHARWGKGTKGRERELRALADWIKDHFGEKWAEDHDLLVGGDFNVPKVGDDLYKALTSQGLKQPRSLAKLTAGDKVLGGTNLGKSARYDQILYLPAMDDRRVLAGGTLDFFVNDAHIEELYPGRKLTRQAFSFQLSDHLPLWVQLDTDIDGWRLDQIVQAGGKK